MSKAIRMTRRELVWETRVNEFDESDWQSTLEWLKSFTEKEPRGSWDREHITIYNAVKDLTWEQVVADYEKWDAGDEKANLISWELVSEGWGFDENNNWTRQPDKDRPYKQYLGEFLHEMIQEDNYNADVEDYDYAGDYDEDVVIIED